MQLSFITSALLGLTAFSGLASSEQTEESKLALYGAPRHNLDGVLPVLSIEEQYIRSQTDGGVTAFGGTDLQCSASNPCPDGSCCNSQGQCGYRDEHCKKSCVANCDAKALCGVDSKDGSQTCPLNVCCSHFGFCGASEFFCRDSTASGESTPCQKGFGKCGTVNIQATPSCGKGSGTASRRVAYYEGWNTRRRPCDKVWPADIDTTGLTHLIFSFATIDPTTFAVGPMHPDDEKLYANFLGLKDGSQKWIGIGGWEFSDAGATRYTWSQMASSKANRSAFVSSLLDFLEKWEFAGVDIDWEWPGAESRGGNPTIDKQNQISLTKELREALGSRGLSVVLPAQFEYLKNLDPKSLEGYVDAFNILAYDLHGPWDATIPGLGPFAKPHTDLNEIDAVLELLWFSDVTPAQVNLGIANYGRGYTLADASCAHLNCTWTGPSKPGQCTELAGVLSQCEIQRIISQKKLKPEMIEGAGVKQIVFDGQWFGFDDSETLRLKTELANSRCLGGTALWAIDYASCTGGGPVGPDAPQLSSAAPAPSAPDMSIAPPAESSAPAAPSAPAASSAPAVSSAPAASSKPAASSTISSTSAKPPSPVPSASTSSSAPAASSLPTSSTPAASSIPVSAPLYSAASSASPPAQSSQAASSAPAVTSSATSRFGTSAAPTTAVPIVPSVGLSAPASSIAASSTPAPSMGSLPASPTASSVAPSSQTSQAWSSSLTLSSTAAQTGSGSVIVSSSQALSSGAPPVMVVPSSGSSRSSAVITASTSDSSSAASSSSSSATSQDVLTRSSLLASGSFAWSSVASLSSTPASSSSSLASGTLSQSSSAATSSSDPSTTSISSGASASSTASSGSSTSDTASSWGSSSVSTTGTTSDRASSSAEKSTSIHSSSEQSSAAASSVATSSQASSGITSSSLSPSRSGTASGRSSHSASLSFATSSGTTSSPQSSSAEVTSRARSTELTSVSRQTSAWSQSTITSTAQTSMSSQQSSTAGSSAALSSETHSSSTIVGSRPGPTSDASSTQSRDRSTTSDDDTTTEASRTQTSDRTTYTTDGSTATVTQSSIGTTSVGSAELITLPATATSTSPPPNPTAILSSICPKCSNTKWCSSSASKMVTELPEFPPLECIDNEWCLECWPKPPAWKPEMCPWQCWLLDWCKPLCNTPVEKLPDVIPPPGIEIPWFTTWWWQLPVANCVPNDCNAECHQWFGLTLALVKQPFCPCVPRTCTKGEKEDNKKNEKCKLLGCGCGFMGLPFVCDIKIKIEWSVIFPFGIFGPEPCKFFGGCLPPLPTPPGNKVWSDEGCGPLGCRGYCYDDEGKGCGPCPSQLCGGPKCTRPGGCGPRVGPDPTPVPSREPKKCEEKDKTTVTERIVSCFVDLKLEPTTIASINYTQTETLTSACISFEATISGCGVLGTSTTTTVSSLTTTSSSSEAPMCTRAPLDLNNDEGDNPQPPRTTTDGPTCSRAPLSLDDDEGDNEQPQEGPSCTRAPLSLDDDEGDNSQPTSSEVPACTRAPLSLDDDEGNNEMPADMSSGILFPGTVSLNPSMWPTASSNSSILLSTSMPLTSSSANFSSSASRVLPPSTLSMTTTPPWGTGIPSGTPGPQCSDCNKFFVDCTSMRCPDGSDAAECAKFCLTAVCYDKKSPDYCKNGPCRPATCPKDQPHDFETAEPAIGFTTVLSLTSKTFTVTAFPTGTPVPKCPTCDLVFADCAKEFCKPDGSDAEKCAKFCLANLCYGDHAADYCKRGPCKPAACPNSQPRDYGTAQPAIPFTTILSLPSTTVTVTATPTYAEPTLTHSPTPKCDPNHSISPNGKWTVLFEHSIFERPDNATLKWNLWDEHGCHAGEGMAWNQFLGYNITTQIGAFGRTPGYNMGYTLHTNVTESLSTAESEIYFQISKPVADCKEMCHTEWKVNKREPGDSWQILNDCAQQCGSQKLTPADVSCESGVNKWQDIGDSPTNIRGGYCTFSMPFKPGNDEPSTSWTRASQWTLDIVQWTEYEQSSVQWWLKDPNGNNASSQLWDTTKVQRGPLLGEYISGGYIQEPRMPYTMYLMIRSPRTKENSTIELTYLNEPYPDRKAMPCNFCWGMQTCNGESTPMCQPSYRTETNDEKSQAYLDDCTDGQNPHNNRKFFDSNMMAGHTYCKTSVFQDNKEFSCDKVADAFYSKGAGFERRFRCWWPHDFVGPYEHQGRDGRTGDDLVPEYVRYQTRFWKSASASDFGGLNGTVGTLAVGDGEKGS